MSEAQDGWKEWSRHVLHELERLKESSDSVQKSFEEFRFEITKELARKSEVEELRKIIVDDRINRVGEVSALRYEMTELLNQVKLQHSVELATLKTELTNKAGIWGAAAGILPAVVTIIIVLISKFL